MCLGYEAPDGAKILTYQHTPAFHLQDVAVAAAGAKLPAF